ncbi:MAG: GNAT family N-acetyltransferase [Actinomycetota bacterium]
MGSSGPGSVSGWRAMVRGEAPSLDDPAAWLPVVIRCGDVVLRTPTPAEVEALADAVRAGGLDDAATRRGLGPWAQGARDEVARNTAEHLAAGVEALSRPSPIDDDWVLPRVVFLDGRPVGRQDADIVATADGWIARTGSWLLNTHRGRGVGTSARTALLAAVFSAGAHRAETSWTAGNLASERVSLRLGHVIDRRGPIPWPDGTEVEGVHAHLDPDDFRPAEPVVIEHTAP